jgi:hypothetical protein
LTDRPIAKFRIAEFIPLCFWFANGNRARRACQQIPAASNSLIGIAACSMPAPTKIRVQTLRIGDSRESISGTLAPSRFRAGGVTIMKSRRSNGAVEPVILVGAMVVRKGRPARARATPACDVS